ncbi:MAG: glycine cleavage T C-terminal barrel domain-containing protein [Acidobacteriota bacterium]
MTRDDFAPLIAIGPRVRKSPFFEATKRYGVKAFTIYNHMFMPTVYTDPLDEYWKLVNDVTIWDVACERQVEITGPDAARFAQYLTPRNLSGCASGQCRYVLLTDEHGGIVNDAVLLRLAENHVWLSPGDGDVLLWARGAALNAGFNVKIWEPDVSPLQLQGPNSPQVARALFGDWATGLKYYCLRETELDDIPVVLARTGWSGEVGYEIFLRDGRRGDELWEKVMKAGRPHGIAPAAPSTIRSIEGGILSYVSDITLLDNPFTIGLDRLVDLEQQADFIGKAALQKIKAGGVRRRLIGVEIGCPPLPGANAEFWPVVEGDKRIGHVTRCVHSPRLRKNIGFANVPSERAALGTRLTIEMPSGRVGATVVRTPFIAARKKISP